MNSQTKKKRQKTQETENRGNWSKIQRKNPENRGRQSTNFIYRLLLSLCKQQTNRNIPEGA
jgi:hypothetical protein